MPAEVIVAAIGAVGTFGSASVAAIASVRSNRKAERTRDIVQGNGHGTVTKVSEDTLHEVRELKRVVTSLALTFSDHVVQDAHDFEVLRRLITPHDN